MIILDPTLSEWLNLLIRWIHVFAGIMWVGTTYYFTWLSGFALLVLVYYLGGGALVDPDVRDLSVPAAVALGIGIIVACGFVYDVMMASPLGRHEKLFAAIAYVLIVVVAYVLTNVFSGRAAYIHLGAIFGTIMAANVWMHILPSQKKMIAALKEGRKPDERLSGRAKLRSKQNTFMAVPVVFIMISNHFPGNATYGYNWIILSALVLVGWIAARFIRRA
jgi:uncharacterized membrane protein